MKPNPHNLHIANALGNDLLEAIAKDLTRPDELEDAIERDYLDARHAGAVEERAKIVAWVRNHYECKIPSDIAADIANQIANAEHLK